jgi:flagellar motor protein MotB
MSQFAFDDPMAAGVRATRSSSGGGWKTLFWFMVAIAAVGFAGYVFLVPYQKMMSALSARTTELSEERATSKQLTAERDQIKGEVEKLQAAAAVKAAADTKRTAAADELGTQLKSNMEAVGATVVSATGRVAVSLPADKIIDTNGIDVSEQGHAILKIFAGTLKNTPGSVRVKTRFSAVPPATKELRELFKTSGELSAVRSARVMSSLNAAGVAADRLIISGEAERPRPVPRGKKVVAPPPPPERVDIEVEPE